MFFLYLVNVFICDFAKAERGFFVPPNHRKANPPALPIRAIRDSSKVAPAKKSVATKFTPIKSKIDYHTLTAGKWFAQDAVANTPRLKPSSGNDHGDYRNYQFRTGGLIVVDVYDKAHPANHAAIEYYVIPAEKPPQLNPTMTANGQIQVTASGLKWETVSANDKNRFQIKSPPCDIVYSENNGSAFRSEHNFTIKSCKNKIVIAAGFGEKESPRHDSNFGRKNLTIAFGDGTTCKVLAEKIFVKQKGDFHLKPESEVFDIISKTNTCTDGFAKFRSPSDKLNIADKANKTDNTAAVKISFPKTPIKKSLPKSAKDFPAESKTIPAVKNAR